LYRRIVGGYLDLLPGDPGPSAAEPPLRVPRQVRTARLRLRCGSS